MFLFDKKVKNGSNMIFVLIRNILNIFPETRHILNTNNIIKEWY